MTTTASIWPVSGTDRLTRVGLVVHPARNIDGPLSSVQSWAEASGTELLELPGAGEHRTGLPHGDFAECDLIVAIGGDGTTLGAIRGAAEADRLVLGVACGSLGALTAVMGADAERALDRCAAGDFVRRPVSALVVAEDGGEDRVAFNDLAFVRRGDGQIRVTATVNGAIYARLAGDGCIVSTPLGSSAYTIAARGPLVDPALAAIIFTPLPSHGGFAPPLVLDGGARLELDLRIGYGGARLEVDGRGEDTSAERLEVTLRADAATVVSFSDSESHLTGLRRRGVITDSPRILAEDRRRTPASSPSSDVARESSTGS